MGRRTGTCPPWWRRIRTCGSRRRRSGSAGLRRSARPWPDRREAERSQTVRNRSYARVVAGMARVLLASNRGPVSFAEDGSGDLFLRRGSGGLVSGLMGAASDNEAVWVLSLIHISEPTRRTPISY